MLLSDNGSRLVANAVLLNCPFTLRAHSHTIKSEVERRKRAFFLCLLFIRANCTLEKANRSAIFAFKCEHALNSLALS